MANVEGIIVSAPENGVAGYGLTEVGRQQVRSSADKLVNLRRSAHLFSSDFLRAVETAEIIRSVLELEAVQLEPLLRERFFGQWEGACYRHYAEAWEKDEINADLESNGAESANAVRSRMEQVILSMEARFSGEQIILVSHGDPLRLMQTVFEGLDTEQNGQVPYFGNAECRLLNP